MLHYIKLKKNQKDTEGKNTAYSFLKNNNSN